MEEAETNRKADREALKEMLAKMQEKINAEMEAIRAETKAIRDKRMETNMNDGRKERTACREAREADTEKIQPNPEMMQSIAEHHEDSQLMPVRGLRKWRGDQNLAAGCHQKPKRRIQASFESRKRLTIAGRKVSLHARVAWRKRNIFRKSRT
jgi:hypothetical protein